MKTNLIDDIMVKAQLQPVFTAIYLQTEKFSQEYNRWRNEKLSQMDSSLYQRKGTNVSDYMQTSHFKRGYYSWALETHKSNLNFLLDSDADRSKIKKLDVKMAKARTRLIEAGGEPNG